MVYFKTLAEPCPEDVNNNLRNFLPIELYVM